MESISGRQLASLPLDFFVVVGEYLLAQDITRLLFTGDSALLSRLGAVGGGIQRFELRRVTPLKLRGFGALSTLASLKTLTFYAPSWKSASIALNFDSLPRSLTKLELYNFVAETPRRLDLDHLLPNLRCLHLDRNIVDNIIDVLPQSLESLATRMTLAFMERLDLPLLSSLHASIEDASTRLSEDNSYNLDNLFLRLSRMPHLTHLAWKQRENVPDIFPHLPPSLLSLDLSECNLEQYLGHRIGKHVLHVPLPSGLHSLVLPEVGGVSPDRMRELPRTLTSLTIRDPSQIFRMDGLMVEALPPNLKQLMIHSDQFSPDAFDPRLPTSLHTIHFLLSGMCNIPLRHLNNLTSLSLPCTEIQSDSELPSSLRSLDCMSIGEPSILPTTLTELKVGLQREAYTEEKMRTLQGLTRLVSLDATLGLCSIQHWSLLPTSLESLDIISTERRDVNIDGPLQLPPRLRNFSLMGATISISPTFTTCLTHLPLKELTLRPHRGLISVDCFASLPTTLQSLSLMLDGNLHDHHLSHLPQGLTEITLTMRHHESNRLSLQCGVFLPPKIQKAILPKLETGSLQRAYPSIYFGSTIAGW